MRPRRLELEGFTAFRDTTVVDFEGADLFAFVGPTGSGKSSLVDAVLFALYGVVPRYGDKRAVEPVVSLGKNEARVRFDFSVGDADYTAARVVRRTKTGATTAEARLEGGTESVKGADEVTEAVEALLGLGFDHFTKCVVLPQGEFAAFLHDSAAKRQELLRQLLDLGRYRRMRELAVGHQRTADNMVEVLTTQLDDLAFATDAALAVAETRRDRLEALRDEMDAQAPKLEKARDQMKSDQDEAERARRDLDLVRTIEAPPGLGDLTELADQAAEQVAAAEAAVVQATEERVRLDEESAALPEAAAIARLGDLHERLARELELEAKAAGEERLAQHAAGEARAAAGKAEQSAQEATGRLEALRREHAAHALAGALEVGEPCPVCRREIEKLPAGARPRALGAAEKAVARAGQQLAKATAAATQAGEALAALEARSSEGARRVASLREELVDQPDAAETTRLHAARAELETRIRHATTAEQEAMKRLAAARQEDKEVAVRIEEARRRFDAARDSVAALSPPVPERTRLDADWAALADWAVDTARTLTAKAENKERSIKEAATSIAEHERRFVGSLAELEVTVGERRPRDVCVETLAEATQQLAKIVEARSKTADLGEKREAHKETGLVAKSLARHLAATGFEGWLMAEALEALVVGANLRLDDLSSGAFSLELEKRDFRVVDHRNADERRPVKTLSGGETFLVSLALALALAEQLASMSVHGVARLESMFLDEGFGTLDAETLDVVATVIHELGSDGRTIGLITHVKDLAEQVPVRFEVRKGPGGATVERVDA